MEDSSYSYSFKSKSETSSGGESPAPSKPPRKKATGPKKVRRIVQAVLILGEVGRRPVQQHADVRLMTAVDELHELLRRTVAGGGRVIARHLIAP